MSSTYKRITTVNEISQLSDGATVFVNDNGALRQVKVAQFLSGTDSSTTVLRFRGLLSSLPATSDYEDGDVVLVGDREYIYYATTWYEFGTTSGIKGADGITYVPDVGDVNTLDPGDEATVTLAIDEDARTATYSFGIPRGERGGKGDKGDPGTGIVSVEQTTVSTDDGGVNEITITLTDGSISTMQVRNGIGEGGTYVDTELTMSGAAADAKVVGDHLSNIGNAIEQLQTDTMTAVKTINGQGPDENGNVVIEVTSTQDGTVIDDTLTVAGAAADAKAVGDKISTMEETMLTQTDIPQALPNPYMLTINGTPYDGSAFVAVTTVQTVNGVAPDENGNITIAVTESGEGTGIMSVIQTTTSEEDDGVNIITVTLTNGETSSFAVQNGSKGTKGDKGDAPVKGADYWTDEDKSSIINDVLAALPAAEGVSF